MITFLQYLREMENSEGLGDFPVPAGDDALLRIAKIAVDDHRGDTLSFFRTLAMKDRRIEQELRGIQNAKRDKPEHEHKDEVMPAAADAMGGSGEDV